MEGDENGKLDCSPISILDDEDFETIKKLNSTLKLPQSLQKVHCWVN